MSRTKREGPVDSKGDFIRGEPGEWIIYADSFKTFLMKCQEVLHNSTPYVKKMEIEEAYKNNTQNL